MVLFKGASLTQCGYALGYVIQVNPDFLKLVTSHNEVLNVKQAAITKKIFPKRNQFALDKNNNTLAAKSIVRILDGSIFKVSFLYWLIS